MNDTGKFVITFAIGASAVVALLEFTSKPQPIRTAEPSPTPTPTPVAIQAAAPIEQPIAPVTWAQVNVDRAPQAALHEVKTIQKTPSLDWQNKSGKCIDMALGGIVVVPRNGTFSPPPPIDPDTGREIVNVGQFTQVFESYGKPFIVMNYPKSAIRQDPVSCRAINTGSGIYKGRAIEIWDCNP